MIAKKTLEYMYISNNLSMNQIANNLGVSLSTVDWWMRKHEIRRRSRSGANYVLYNPDGDPFKINALNTPYLNQLYGVGIGLYWGEGNKANKNSVRIGNTDSKMILKFIEFLTKIYSIDTTKLRFSIQTFDDTSIQEVEEYWQYALGFDNTYFTKTTVSKSGLFGNYTKKSKYGVLTLNFHNTKLRNILVDALPKNGVKYID